MDAASFHLAEMREQRGQKPIRSSDQPTGARVQLVVGHVIEGVNRGRSKGVHTRTLHPDFQDP